jgi:hypothetical protein
MRTSYGRAAVLTISILAALVTVWGLIAPPGEVPKGLSGRYFASADWSGEPLLERIDDIQNTETLTATSAIAGRETFSVEWTGALIVRRDGIHRFATKSDDGTWLWIGDQLVIDNGGSHAATNVWAELPLTRGVHPFRLRYSQTGGDYFLQLGQAGPAGQMVPPEPLIPVALSYREVRVRELWSLVPVAGWYLAGLSIAIAGFRLGRTLPVLSHIAEIWADRGVRLIVVSGMALTAAHIAYGIPAIPSFSADELEPLDTLLASETGFRRWNLRWPPLHAFFITLALQPFRWAETLFHLSLHDEVVVGAMYLVSRGLSVLLVGLALMLTFDVARMLAERRAGYFAAALLATSPLVVFFGSLSNLEVPHLFWVTLTFWAWLKLWQQRSVFWFAVFGASVGLSIAAKDQAYGYYVIAPFALALLVRRDRASHGDRSWLGALSDRRLVYVALSAVAAMAIGHALPFWLDRFVDRLAVLGAAPAQFRIFSPSFEGYVALLSSTAKSFWWAAGSPLLVAFLMGMVTAVRRRQWLPCGLLLPAMTYSITFLAVILYVYDRFLIGWLPIAAAIGGIGLSALWGMRRRGHRLGAVVVTAILAAGVVNGVAINVVFHRDPRHEAWRWLQAQVPCGSSVGVTFNAIYLPPLDCYDVWGLLPSSRVGMTRWPRFLVLNEAYMERFRDTPDGARFLADLRSGALGYWRLERFEATPPPWSLLYWEPRFRNRVEDIETTTDKPLHAIEVWECRDREGCDRPPS